jgi:hypothetical protein
MKRFVMRLLLLAAVLAPALAVPTAALPPACSCPYCAANGTSKCTLPNGSVTTCGTYFGAHCTGPS